MAKSHVIQTLIENSRALMDSRARDLQKARQSQDQANEYLKMLTDYRRDYHAEMQRVLMQGTETITSNYYRDFLVSLDKALEQARQAVEDQNAIVQGHTQAWNHERVRVNTFGKLQERNERAIQRKVSTQEQKASDEFGNRARKHHSLSTSLGF